MSAIPPSIDDNPTPDPKQPNSQTLTLKGDEHDSPETDKLSGLDLPDLDLNPIDTPIPQSPRRQGTTDLVRLYLQEIGRVPLLSRDEEVAEAQKVQRYMTLLDTRKHPPPIRSSLNSGLCSSRRYQ